jgi:HK97 family phage major capsid protein
MAKDDTKDITAEDVKQELGKISDLVREQGEKALAEAKKAGDMNTETKGKVDELLVKQGELQARLLDTEQKLAKAGQGGGEQRDMTPGQELVESQAFKDWSAARNTKTPFTIPVKALTSLPSSVGPGVWPDRLPGLLPLPRMRLTVRDLITPGRTSSSSISYVRELSFTDNAGMVSEGTKKPEADMAVDEVTSKVVKIAQFMKATTEILDDFPMLQSFVDGRLRYSIKLKEESQLLKGSGTGNNLNGIYTQATAYSAPITPPGTLTKIDVLRLMLLQASLAFYPSTGIVLHPSDWAAIELTKSTTEEYIWADPRSMATPGLWGLPVVATQAMTVDTALVGAFQLGAQIFDRMQSAVTIATENEDDFVKNIVTILAEERLALAVYLPAAFVKNTNLPA